MSWDIILFSSEENLVSLENLNEDLLKPIDFDEILKSSFMNIKKKENHNEIIGKDFSIEFFDDEELPIEIAQNKCNALTGVLIDNSNLLVTKMKFQIRDCQNNLLFETAEVKTREKDIQNQHWEAIDFVIEATGKFKTYNEAYLHIEAGAKKVILSAPSEVDDIKTVVLGVNEHILNGEESIISNASCNTSGCC